MKDRLHVIIQELGAIAGLNIITPLSENSDGIVSGGISLTEGDTTLDFELKIYPMYPFQFHEMESIQFYNSALRKYGHVNSDGSICVHTLHSGNITDKLHYDIESLKQWMIKYYINAQQDQYYEHIVVSESANLSERRCFLFTEVEHAFKENTYGTFRFSYLAEGKSQQDKVVTYLIQSFKIDNQHVECKWAAPYSHFGYKEGAFVFIKNPPVTDNRFMVETWSQLQPYVAQDFLSFMYGIARNTPFAKKGIKDIPVLIGYNIPSGEVHWQCAVVDVSSFPLYADKVDKGKYVGYLSDAKIDWVQTKNCSYDYFFGRGKLANGLTEKKILLIGIGAIGSIVATILARGGCRSISLVDYDVKEPENVCRSEFNFSTGINNKVDDLRNNLIKISPFLNVSGMPKFMDAIKIFINNKSLNGTIREVLEQYDYVFDCTADNDVAYILSLLQPSAQVINLSITNNANELVCGHGHNAYQWVNVIFKQLKKEDDDLYRPTGCWSPTFKASYNDVNVLVQFAMKYINSLINQGKGLRNFYLSVNDNDGLTVKLNHF